MEKHNPTNTPCPYCHSAVELHFSTHINYFFHCSDCDLIFKIGKHPADRDNPEKYYAESYFDEYAYDQLSGQRNNLYSHILNRIENVTDTGTLLDVGCGCGVFLKVARDRGWNIAGIDISEESIAYCERILGTGVAQQGTFKDLSRENVYDVITMINVLDHLTEPWVVINKAGFLLRPGGLIFLRFPNGILHPTLFKMSEKVRAENFIHRFLVFHEYSFTPKFISKLLSDRGFSKIVIRNSPLVKGHVYGSNPAKKRFGNFLNHMIWSIASTLDFCSRGRILIGPSLEVFARKL